ncbi:DUF916 and DUF3324 domain-containing protein [Enterococcus sp. LJL128]|uniref:DUF916 and DUF3324 domain-containing protein n=1 Tax=Enterococcus sp. LJL51 TaxID=3416656 RepID=UPI003CEEADD6
MIKKKIMQLLLVVLIGIILLPSAIIAEATDQSGQNKEAIGFTVKPVLPNNQVDSSKGFYFLKVEPGQQQSIQLRVISTREEARTVRIHVNDAVTSAEGSIEYGIDEPELDESLQSPISEVVTVPESYREITVENFEEKTVQFDIAPPQDAFTGIKAGAFRILGVPEGEEKKKSGLTVQTGYTIGIVLTEDAAQYNAGGNLNLKKTEVILSNGSKVIGVTLQNDQPKIIEGLELKAEIMKKGSTKVLYKTTGKDLAVAPNSRFTYEVPMGIDNVTAGNYTLQLTLKNDEKEWTWEEDFLVTGEQAASLNDETIDKIITPSWVSPMAIVLTVSLVGTGSYLPYRRKKIKKKNKIRRKKKK